MENGRTDLDVAGSRYLGEDDAPLFPCDVATCLELSREVATQLMMSQEIRSFVKEYRRRPETVVITTRKILAKYVRRHGGLRKAQKMASEQWRRLQLREALISEEWQSYRGEEFEEWLRRAFEHLGYTVCMTKKSCDRGADLIIERHKLRVAVQAKTSWGKKLGSRSVMEAFVGKAFYRCDFCCVVTNNSFCRSARNLALDLKVLLIDASDIPGIVLCRPRLRTLFTELEDTTPTERWVHNLVRPVFKKGSPHIEEVAC